MSEPGIVTVTDVVKGKEWVARCEEKSKVLSFVGLYLFRGHALYVLADKGTPLSFHTCYFAKRRTDVWHPYTTWGTAYTIKSERRKGHATRLALHAREEAIKRGCVRLKSMIGSTAGLMLHFSLGDEVWGLTEDREFRVDTPLVPNEAYVGKRPPNAAPCSGDKPWSLARCLESIPDGLPYDER